MIDAAHDEWLTDGVMSRRAVAFLIDGVLIAVLLFILKIALLGFGLVTLGLGLPLLGLLPLVPFLYVLVFIASERSATPGQQAMGVLVRRNEDLSRPTGLQALIWTIGLSVTLACGVVWVAVALITLRHRTLHDLVSGLVVTRSRAVMPRTGIWNVDAGGTGRPFA